MSAWPTSLVPSLVSIVLAFSSVGCASRRQLASELVAATTPGHMRPIVACWEREYEQSGFQGSYVAVVDFEISGSERLRNAKVTSLEPAEGSSTSRDLGPFRSCLEKAFDEIELPSKSDAEGPGFGTAFGVAVKGYRIAFLGDDALMKRAEGLKANVLFGPRADRCRGLYIYGPPRDTSALFTEISVAKEKVEQARQKGDRDELARELQRTYDLHIELSARLWADLADQTLPPANRKRLTEALEAALEEKHATGEAIGCGDAE